MHELEYQPSDGNPRTARQLRWIVLLGVIAVLVAVGIPILNFVSDLQKMKAAATSFDARTSQAALLGKTPKQIIALFGAPMADSRGGASGDTDQSCVIAYEDPSGEICRIEITNGAASRVDHYAK